MDDTRLPNGDQRQHAWFPLLVGLLVLAAAAGFIARGPFRALSNPSDFILVYGPARTWLMGGNPYDMPQIDRVWLEAHGPPDLAPSRRDMPGLLYPPTTLPMLAPFAALTWPAAHRVWITANIAFVGVILWSVARIAGFHPRQRRTWLYVAGGLVFAPVHTTIHHGQTPLYVMAVGLVGFALAPAGARGGGGLLLGLAAGIKPQIGLPMLALEGVRARWRSVLIGSAALMVLLIAAIGPMTWRGVPWWDSWRDNLAAFRSGGAGDPVAGNPYRHQLVNLQYPLTALLDNKTIGEVAALVIVAAFAMLFFLPPAKRMRQTSLLHSLSMVAVLSLMVVYHRFYDAVLLLIPLAWAIDGIARARRSALPWCALALLVPFFLNSTTALVWLRSAGHLPVWLVDCWCWEHLLLPHQGWALLALAVCLLVAQRRGSDDWRPAKSSAENRAA